MREHRYRILNVFTTSDDRLSGNPLCVFEDGSPFSGETMQAIARQMNLSETTFLLPPASPSATARVRIFTPTFEMPFAGHPTLGTAHVTRALGASAGNEVKLEMIAGVVAVTANGDRWTFETARPPETRVPVASKGELAKMLGLPKDAVADALWVDTGSEQLVIALRGPADVRDAKPDALLLERHARSDKRGSSLAYVWAPVDPSGGEVLARFFFVSGTSLLEDPATGSACANLAGYKVATGAPLPLRVVVRQGEAVARPSILRLEVDAGSRVFVSGDVFEVGRGVLVL